MRRRLFGVELTTARSGFCFINVKPDILQIVAVLGAFNDTDSRFESIS
jgi:hypothetical protein